MPILDAAPLDREDEDVLRGMLGPASRPPMHAEQMREAARRAGESATVSAEAACRSSRLLSAIKNSDRARGAPICRLHSSV